MRPSTLSSEEIASRGPKIYDESIRDKVETQHHGDFVVIDIDSGDYEVGIKDIDASLRLRQRHPEAITFGFRVGSATACRLGGQFPNQMIVGQVTARREAVVSISMIDREGIRHSLQAVVDTGFTGELTLPATEIEKIGLEFFGSRPAMLADGSKIVMDNYFRDIVWHDQSRRTVVLESEGGPLVGMELLEGSDVALRVESGGSIRINEIERS